MYLDIVDAVHPDKVLQQRGIDHNRIHDIPPKLHRKQTVRIAPEGLGVEKIAPAPQNLPDQNAEN